MNLIELKSKTDNLQKDIDNAKLSQKRIEEKIQENQIFTENSNKAIQVISDVLSITQNEILSYIENVVTTALQYIYGENYSFKIKSTLKRNQPEIELSILRGTLEIPPEMGGIGVLDIVSFALRCACFSLLEPQPDPILIFDEPFRFISGIEQLERAEMMVKKLSEMLEIQIIIVSGKNPFTNYSDKTFLVEMINGESIIQDVN